MARTVADCARMLEVIAGPDGMDPRQTGLIAESYTEALDQDAAGLRVGVLREGFGIPGASEPDVDQAVRAAAETLAKGGAHVEEVSVPLHADGLAIWNGIVIEGAADLGVNGNAFGTNWAGHYPLDLLDFFARARRARGGDLPPTVMFAILLGGHLAERYGHHYYAKSQNLSRSLRAAYAEQLANVDVLVMPTTAMKAVQRPADGSVAATLLAALGNLHNTAPFDATGNPAMSVPCELSDGLPVGFMIVGRHGDDRTVLRAGHVYERLRGPFPQPELN